MEQVDVVASATVTHIRYRIVHPGLACHAR
jgi:hypothetical protein